MTIVDTALLRDIAELHSADVVVKVVMGDLNELRVVLRDGSFIDIWFSLKLAERYSFHWERRAVDGTIYRHDNAPHRRWRGVPTIPRHLHDGSETSRGE